MNGFIIPGKSIPSRACNPCFVRLSRENLFPVANNYFKTNDCHILRHAYSLIPFNISKNQLLTTLNRISVLLVSDQSTKYCSLCKEDFNLLNWKVI